MSFKYDVKFIDIARVTMEKGIQFLWLSPGIKDIQKAYHEKNAFRGLTL